ncbi:cyclase family protein [Microbacterium sp. 179-I 3D3 NHS]|uniref:cyclase family protein n=1 Tax=Microbacterium sp. 179-I 3D3 NHS TaxID=3142382 RepID=UPI0039A0F096
MTTALIDTVRRGTEIFDLGRPFVPGMPQSPNHPAYTHALQRRHGDMVRPDGGSAANDFISMGTHVGTHMDALAHVSHCGELYGGVPVEDAVSGGRFSQLGIDTVRPLVTPGILLDIPSARGVEQCDPGYEITPDDLDRAVAVQGVEPREGDVILVRSGWDRNWDDRERYIGRDSGVPGVGEAGAEWLAARRPSAVGADTIAFEQIAPGKGHAVLPAHRVLLVEHGINIIETMNLQRLAESGHRSFVFVVSPLEFVGATGSPVRPLAIVAAA